MDAPQVIPFPHRSFDGQPRPTRIPMVIHQSWKTAQPPLRWVHTIASVKQRHPWWEYRLWTDETALAHVREYQPELYPIFVGFNRGIMRADVMRYVLMHDIGGMYCDLDYEFIRPYDYGDAAAVLGFELETALGDHKTTLANFVFASSPGHVLWRDVIERVIREKPRSRTQRDVIDLTGPGLLTRVYMSDPAKYADVVVEPKLVFNPYRMRGKHERMALLNNGVTVGLHHAFGSWKQRWKLSHWKHKLTRLTKRAA